MNKLCHSRLSTIIPQAFARLSENDSVPLSSWYTLRPETARSVLAEGDSCSLGVPAMRAGLPSRFRPCDGLRDARTVLNGTQSHYRALGQMSADAVFVAILVAARARHCQSAAVRSGAFAVEQFAHTLAEVARQEGV